MHAIAPTDGEWFTQLRSAPPHPLINFWTPTPWNVRHMFPGDRLYFMLKSPIRKVGGFGHFVRYANMSANQAWEEFGPGNGVTSAAELVARSSKYARKRASGVSAEIGCIVLRDAEFLTDADFIDPQRASVSFSDQVVKLKYFEKDPLGALFVARATAAVKPFELVGGGAKAYKDGKQRERHGQAAFRAAVLAAYKGHCCIGRESCSEVLEAAHIEPYVNEDSDHVQNGLALRVDLHRLFDAGLITVRADYTVRVSTRLKSAEYAKLSGQRINLPLDAAAHPSPAALAFHAANVFRP